MMLAVLELGGVTLCNSTFRQSGGREFWLSVLTEIKNRGTGDVCILVS
jgi:hypothetical protein